MKSNIVSVAKWLIECHKDIRRNDEICIFKSEKVKEKVINDMEKRLRPAKVSQLRSSAARETFVNERV